MKNRNLLFLCLALCATLTSFAQTFTVDGLNYTVTSTSPNEVTLTGGTPPTSDLVIPDIVNDGINDFTVVALGNTAFESAGLTSVVIPNTIRNIGNDAFTGNQLTTIFIPNGVETIGIRAFRLNQIGGDLVLPNSVTNLGNAAFEANNISNLTIPESLSVIPNHVFRNNDLSSVTIPASITSIGINSFRTNPLTQVIAEGLTPASLFSGSNDSFFGSRPNIDLTVPTNTEEDYATAGWTGFATVNGEVPLETGNTFDVGGLFYQITALNPNEVEVTGGTNIPTNLVLPETVTIQGTVFTVVGVGDGAFTSSGLTSVTFPTTIRTIGSLAFRFNALTSVVIPEGVTDLPNRCFASNDLTSVTLPNSIETIGFRSFENNPLTTITFPENVASITSLAFSNNPLNTITSLNTTPPSIQGDTFSNRQNIDLTVPDTTEDAYATAGWVGFNSVNGVIDFEVGDTFTENNFNYTVTSLSPNEVSVTGGNAVPQNLNINETVSNGGSDFAVTAVGSSAFISNGLTSVSLPNTITTIEGQAFRNNQLTSITIPENVSLVAFRAFEGNPLSEVIALGSVPASITTGDNDTFSNRSSIDLLIPTGTQLDYLNSGWTGFATINGELPLDIGNTVEVNGLSYTVTALNPTEVEAAGGTSIPTNLVLPETVTIQGIVFTVIGVGDGAFTSSGLTSVTFPTTIRTIGSLAFRFNALTSVVIPEGVTDVPNRCFASNDLTSVTFPSSLETIGFRSFENNNLTTLLLPENVVSIGQLAFNNSTLNSMNSLNPTPPSVVLGTGDDSFGNENNIDLTVPDGTEAAYEAAGWVGFNSLNGVINFEVGDTFIVNNLNYTVSSVSPNEVTITGGTAVPQDLVINAIVSSDDSDFMVRAVGSNAFDASDLTSVILPNTLVSIGANGFRNNDLTSVVLPNNLVSIGGQGFRNNELTSITFPETISSIGFRAFEGNPLSEVIALSSVPASITTGDNDTFSNRSSIDLLIPEGTTQAYLDGGWTGFNSINSIVIGTEFEVDGLSYRITSLTPNEVVVTGGVNIPNDLVVPEVVSFGGEGFTLVGADFRSFDAEGLDSVILPNTLRNIGDFAFENNGMPSVEIPEGVETISFRSFRGNTLTTITIPSTVTSIAQDAFANNPLQTVTALGTIPAAIETLTFGDRSGIDLFIPEGTLPAYINAGWIGFASVTEITIDITVAPKVFLQGASLNPIAGEENLMRDSLRENGLLPTISPYGDGATVDPTVFTTTGANAIVDWVLVELRSGADNENTTVVNSTSAFLQRDGDVVDVDGVSTITFTEEEGDYFIAIKHRNHIGVLAAVPAALSSTASSLDFTQDAAFAKGENLALTTLVNGTFAMIAGDADGSSQILNTDITEALTLAGGGEAYATADADMNGFVLNSDIQLLVLANSGTVQQFE